MERTIRIESYFYNLRWLYANIQKRIYSRIQSRIQLKLACIIFRTLRVYLIERSRGSRNYLKPMLLYSRNFSIDLKKNLHSEWNREGRIVFNIFDRPILHRRRRDDDAFIKDSLTLSYVFIISTWMEDCVTGKSFRRGCNVLHGNRHVPRLTSPKSSLRSEESLLFKDVKKETRDIHKETKRALFG